MNNPLWKTTDELLEFMNNIEIDPETGEVNHEQFVELEQKYENIEAQIEDGVNYLRRTATEAENAKAEAKKIDDYSKTLKKKAQSYSDYLKFQMQRLGIKKITVSGRPATVVKNPKSLDVNKDVLDEKWKTAKIKMDPDKERIREHIAAGGDVPEGVVVVNDKFRLKY